ncbi:MAG: hypothetical protein ACPHK0_08595 [Dehalococcoidia bacterium]
MTFVYQCDYEQQKHITKLDEKYDSIPCQDWTLTDSPCYASAKLVTLQCSHGCNDVFETVEAIEAHYAKVGA